MADFVAVLKKTLSSLGETTPQMRARVYDKARTTIAAKLAALDPQPPEALAERQKKALEDAIATVESDYAAPPPPAENDPLAELETLFSSIDRNKNQPTHAAPSSYAPVTPAPAPLAEPEATPALPKADEPPQPEAPEEFPQAEEPDAPVIHSDPTPESVPEYSYPGSDDPGDTDDADDVFDPLPDTHISAEPSLAGSWPSQPPVSEPLAFEPHPDTDTETGHDEGERRSYKGLITALIALAVLAGGGYAAWLNKTAIGEMFASSSDTGELKPTVVTPVKVPPPSEDAAATEPPAEPAPVENSGEASEKFTQRLLPSGEETDPGPAGGSSSIGEGSSVVALTTPPPTVAPGTGSSTAPSAASSAEGQEEESAQSGVAVGQKAIYYEERTNLAQGSAETGNVVWSLVQESPGGDEPPEPAIRGEVQIPDKDVQLRMTIRRNADTTLPASHIIELIFLTPTDFEGGGIDGLLRIAFKAAEQDAGNPLIGVPAKIADGYFLVALNDTKADEDANMALFRNQEWIDIPVIYKSGRRALLTMEKGIPGDKVFDEAMKAWQEKTAAN